MATVGRRSPIGSSNKRPITSALANLQGQYFTNQNLIAAGALDD
jgi:multiple sugar transport system permease protein